MKSSLKFVIPILLVCLSATSAASAFPANFTMETIAVGTDNSTRILWFNNSTEQTQVETVSSTGAVIAPGTPFTVTGNNWLATNIALGPTNDVVIGAQRNNSSSLAGIWRVNAAGNLTSQKMVTLAGDDVLGFAMDSSDNAWFASQTVNFVQVNILQGLSGMASYESSEDNTLYIIRYSPSTGATTDTVTFGPNYYNFGSATTNCGLAITAGGLNEIYDLQLPYPGDAAHPGTFSPLGFTEGDTFTTAGVMSSFLSFYEGAPEASDANPSTNWAAIAVTTTKNGHSQLLMDGDIDAQNSLHLQIWDIDTDGDPTESPDIILAPGDQVRCMTASAFGGDGNIRIGITGPVGRSGPSAYYLMTINPNTGQVLSSTTL